MTGSVGMACLSGVCIDKEETWTGQPRSGPLWMISCPVDTEPSLGFRIQDELLVSRGRGRTLRRVLEVLVGEVGDV